MANRCAKEEHVFFEEKEECLEGDLESESMELSSDDDSDGDPTYDLLQEKLSGMSLKKSRPRMPKKMDTDSEEETDAGEVEVPELNEKDGKCFEEVESLIKGGQLGKLKVEQCKVYLRKNGLRLTGNKDVLLGRIREHLEVKDGEGEKKYPVSSFVINCKGDACTGDVVMFEQKVYEMFSIASRSATGPPLGDRTVAGRIVKESYGAAKQQHTFTIEVLWSKGEKPLPPLHPLLIKGRNLYKLKTLRQKWADEEERRKILQEKHMRGHVARYSREIRLHGKEIRNVNRTTKNKSHINVIPHQKSQHLNCQIKPGSILKENVLSQPCHTKNMNIQPQTQVGRFQLPCNGGMMNSANQKEVMPQVQVNIPQVQSQPCHTKNMNIQPQTQVGRFQLPCNGGGMMNSANQKEVMPQVQVNIPRVQGLHNNNSSKSFTADQNVCPVIQNGLLRSSEMHNNNNNIYALPTHNQRIQPHQFSGGVDIYNNAQVLKAQRSHHHLHIGKQQCSNQPYYFSKHHYHSQHTSAANNCVNRQQPIEGFIPPHSYPSILKPPPPHLLPVQRQVCHYYRQGRCRFYENCKFLHE